METKREYLKGLYDTDSGNSDVINIIEDFIREVRTITEDNGERKKLSFKMSGDTTDIHHNQSILNLFEPYGIYDYTDCLSLNFYKGNGTLFVKYYRDFGFEVLEGLSGLTTSEIIFRIFELTIFTNRATRRFSAYDK